MGTVSFFVGPDRVSFDAKLRSELEKLPEDFTVVYVDCTEDKGVELVKALNTSFLFENKKFIIADLTNLSESSANAFLESTDSSVMAFAEKLPSRVVSILKKSGNYNQIAAPNLSNIDMKIRSMADNLGLTLSADSRKFIVARKSTDLRRIYNALLQCSIGGISSPSTDHLRILLHQLTTAPTPWGVLSLALSGKTIPFSIDYYKEESFAIIGFFAKTLQTSINLRTLSRANNITLQEACSELGIPSWQAATPLQIASFSEQNFVDVLDSFNEILLNLYSDYREYYIVKFVSCLRQSTFT